MLNYIVTVMAVILMLVGVALLLKAAFKSDKVEIKNGKRRGDGAHRGIIA